MVDDVALVNFDKSCFIVGTRSGAGKSWHSVGLLSALVARGRVALPFKAMAVVDAEDQTSRDPRPWARAIHHHLMAAGLPYDPDYNPIVAVPLHNGCSVADLYIRGERVGEAPLDGPDSIDVDALPSELYQQCKDAIGSSLFRLARQGAFMVCEGAGSAFTRRKRLDLANTYPRTIISGPTIVVLSGSELAVRQLEQALGRWAKFGNVRVVQNRSVGSAFESVSGPYETVASRRVQLPPSDGSIPAQKRRNSALGEHIWAEIPWQRWLKCQKN